MNAAVLKKRGLLFIWDLADRTSNKEWHVRLSWNICFRFSLCVIFFGQVTKHRMRERWIMLLLLGLFFFWLKLIWIWKILRPKRAVLSNVFIQQMRWCITVNSFVLRQNRTLSKRFSATLKRTRIRFTVIMNPRMLNEMWFLTKTLPTWAVESARVRTRV